MAKTNNLKDFLTDLYEGISSKNPNASRNPQDFRSSIEAIESGSLDDTSKGLIDRSVTEVTIPEGITEIRRYCFYGCSQLTKITIPSTVTSIGNYAFNGTGYKLKDIYFDGTWDDYYNLEFGDIYAHPGYYESSSYARNIYAKNSSGTYTKNTYGLISMEQTSYMNKAGLFCGLKDMTTVFLMPTTITKIPNYYCMNCKSLVDFHFTNSTEVTLGGNGDLEIGEGITGIGYYAFWGCSSLKNLILPSTLTTIDANAFGYTGITTVNLPSSVTTISDYAFDSCRSLASITSLGSITTLETRVIRVCDNLTSVVLPNTLTTIETYAFQSCPSLTSLTIPANVTSIGTYALQIGSSTNKATIKMMSETPPTIATNTFNANYLNSIQVPASAYTAYTAAAGWSTFQSYITTY